MQEARGEGGSPAKAGMKICNLLCGSGMFTLGFIVTFERRFLFSSSSVVCGVFVIVLSALPIAMIVIGKIAQLFISTSFHIVPSHSKGSMNVYKCDTSRLVPIFLIVFGCVSLLQTGIHFVRLICGRKKDSERTERANQGSNCCETIISIFLFVWIIIGSYWVFSLWDTWNSSQCNQSATCCDPVLVYFSFITMLVIYASALLCCSCLVCCICCCAFVAAGSAAAES